MPVVISKGEKSQNRFGAYLHDQLVGVPFGSRVSRAPACPPARVLAVRLQLSRTWAAG